MNVLLSVIIIPSLIKKVLTMLSITKTSLSASASPESFSLGFLFMGSFFMLFCGALILLCINIIVQVYQLKTVKKNNKQSIKNIIIQVIISLIVVFLFLYIPKTN